MSEKESTRDSNPLVDDEDDDAPCNSLGVTSADCYTGRQRQLHWTRRQRWPIVGCWIATLCLSQPIHGFTPSFRQVSRLSTRSTRLAESSFGMDDPAKKSSTSSSTSTTSNTRISDAEALIACRNYLQKRKRWGPWTKAESRKEKRQLFRGDLLQAGDRSGGMGFFWEDPSALKYLHKQPHPLPTATTTTTRSSTTTTISNKSDDGSSILDANNEDDELLLLDEDEEDEDNTEEDEIWESVKLQGSMERRDILPLFENDKVLGDAAEEFSSFFDGPSEEHLKRSNAVKRTWSDPKWRDMWYQKRWGNKPRMNDALKRQRHAENSLQHMDPETLLENEALATMTEDEIAEAIDEYVRLRTKKKAPHTISQQSAPPTENKKDEPSLLDLYVSGNFDTLKQKQQERSQRARRAYETRRAKEEKQEQATKPTSQKQMKGVKKKSTIAARSINSNISPNSPQNALWRIEQHLDQQFMPSKEDVELLLKPQRLSGRKDILIRILNDCFGLRGKCVRTKLEEADPVLEFATKASIGELGNFILYKLRQTDDSS